MKLIKLRLGNIPFKDVKDSINEMLFYVAFRLITIPESLKESPEKKNPNRSRSDSPRKRLYFILC